MIKISVFLFCLLLTGCAGHELNVIESNDFFDPHVNRDRYYTQGLEVYDSWKRCPDDDTQTATLGAAQKIYTPGTKQQTTVVTDDRPYAGLLYAEGSIATDRTPWIRDTFGLKLGIVGPSALGEEIQNGFHALIGDRTAKGWANQLKDEPIANLDYTMRSQGQGFDLWGAKVRTHTYYGADAGNLLVQARLAARASFIQPFSKDLGMVVYATSEGRYKLRDMLLDGNTWKESHSVQKENLIGVLTIGIQFNYKKFFIRYTQEGITKEYAKQDTGDVYGQLFFGYGFFD